ncbi:hypothetical protein F7725_004695 [Dissostichus mawsoni]|uniref:Ig-like domain-containing protein n=1 Tax=Dissostichus mawsoni TaxID=36200 RepID=A0A7J5XJW7_DISMA|nr:hypothetical protein F7725_004695 [Dissostichus mawsoni]
MYSGETITLTCEIEDGGDYEWDYIWTPSSYKPERSDTKYTLTSQSGNNWCKGRLKDTPEPVLTVSPSWPSPGASVTLNCRVDHPSAGWSFYWYKAVPDCQTTPTAMSCYLAARMGLNRISSSLMDKHTQQDITAEQEEEIQCFTLHLNSAASLTVSPDSVQHFTKTSVSLSCEGNSTEWRVMRLYEPHYLRHCSSWGTMTGSTCTITRSWLSGVYWCESETGEFSNAVNITMKCDDDIILVSPVRPVAEGLPVTLSCKFKTENVYDLDFYKNDKLIQNDTRSELTISAVSKHT